MSLAAVFIQAGTVFGQNGTYTTIDFPGATSTIPWWMNGRGDIVGNYSNSSGTHGFLLSGGQYTSVDYPGTNDTELYGINNAGDIQGFYASADGAHHGFNLSAGKYTLIDFPDALRTESGPMNDRGEMVGLYIAADNTTHGFLLSGGKYTSIDFPGSTLTLLSSINAQGDISGSYQAGGIGYGFLLSNGDYTSIGAAGATFTNTTAVSANGDIAGRYTLSGVSHGYLLRGGQYSTFDYPGANYTGLTSVDGRGNILGRYRSSSDNQFHGFLLTGYRPGCLTNLPVPQIGVVSSAPAITHVDFSLVSSAKPAKAGEVLAIFATGLGATRPSVTGGQPFPVSPLAAVDSLVEVRVNGRSAIVLAAVGLPNTVDGFQVNFRLPGDVKPGTTKVELSAGGSTGPAVNISIQ